ncbi:acetyltransferase [Bacteroides sp. K03]|uniref:acetyltransferase n=1 Tax=Bacteroides sp. K03 TaxID=2718928 RepID=UPI001C8B9828|nr:acetyltransferase [Bacteroides sp. K03]MBX9188192.1 acetyltransferase [Bacteroides sp. K03]
MYLFGASGHGKVIKDILHANGIKVKAFVDDNIEIKECAGRLVLHDATGLSPMIVSIGVNHVRKAIVGKLVANNKDIEFVTAIHPSAIMSLSAKIGEGSVVMAGAVINADAVIGKHCIVNTGATIDHECVIEDFCHIAPGVHISGDTLVGEGTWIGIGSCVIQGITIGGNSMIGAGSVVVKDIPDGVVAYGNPCKVVRENK